MWRSEFRYDLKPMLTDTFLPEKNGLACFAVRSHPGVLDLDLPIWFSPKWDQGMSSRERHQMTATRCSLTVDPISAKWQVIKLKYEINDLQMKARGQRSKHIPARKSTSWAGVNWRGFIPLPEGCQWVFMEEPRVHLRIGGEKQTKEQKSQWPADNLILVGPPNKIHPQPSPRPPYNETFTKATWPFPSLSFLVLTLSEITHKLSPPSQPPALERKLLFFCNDGSEKKTFFLIN